MKIITISLSYYNDEEHIQKHLDLWATYYDLVKFQIIDDGSRIPAKEIVKKTCLNQLDGRLFRVLEDIPWNIPGVRNLGATVCSTPWILICDMDQTFKRSELEKMIRLPLKNGVFYSFKRNKHDFPTEGEGRTPGTMLLSIEDFWSVSGYDEDLVGNYGYNDRLFRSQLKNKGIREETPEIYCDQALARCRLTRKLSVNRKKFIQKKTQLPRNSWDILRFKWRQEHI